MIAKCVVDVSSFLKTFAENTVTALPRKNNAFLNLFWSKFLLKNVFK